MEVAIGERLRQVDTFVGIDDWVLFKVWDTYHFKRVVLDILVNLKLYGCKYGISGGGGYGE